MGPVPIQRHHLTHIGNLTVDIWQSCNCIISTMGFPKLVRWHLYIQSGFSYLIFRWTKWQHALYWPTDWILYKKYTDHYCYYHVHPLYIDICFNATIDWWIMHLVFCVCCHQNHNRFSEYQRSSIEVNHCPENQIQCSAIITGQFSRKSSPYTPHSSSVRAGWGMWCLMWGEVLIYVLLQSLEWDIQSHVISDRVIMALDCMKHLSDRQNVKLGIGFQ